MTSFWVFRHCATLTEYFLKNIFISNASNSCFRLSETFRKFFKCLQRVPPSFFSYFSKEWMFKNSQMPPFTFVGTMRLTKDQKKSKENFKKINFFLFFPHVGFVEENTWHIEVLLLFLSLRYGADLGRSRLVSRKWAWLTEASLIVRPPGSTLYGYLSKILARSCQDLGKILAKILPR